MGILLNFLLLISIFLIKVDLVDSTKSPAVERRDIYDSSSVSTTLVSDTVIISQSDSTLAVNENIKVVLVNGEADSQPDYFTYIFPIITLLLGIAVNRLIDYLNKRRQLNSCLRRWTSEIRILENPLIKQISDITDFQREVLEEKHTIPDMGVHSVLRGDSFKSLDKGQFLEALEKVSGMTYQEGISLTNNINGIILSLEHYSTLLHLKYDDYIKVIESRTNSLNENMFQLKKSFNEYSVYLEKKYNDDPMNKDEVYRTMGSLIFDKLIAPQMQNKDPEDIFQLEKSLFLPLIEIISHRRTEGQIQNLLEATSSALRDIQSLRMEKENIHESIGIIKSEFENQLSEVRNVIEQIKKIK